MLAAVKDAFGAAARLLRNPCPRLCAASVMICGRDGETALDRTKKQAMKLTDAQCGIPRGIGPDEGIGKNDQLACHCDDGRHRGGHDEKEIN